MVEEISTLMNNNRNKVVMLRLRNSQTIRGILKEFDIHMNMTLDDTEDISGETPEHIGNVLLRGDNIMAVSFQE